MHMYICTCIPTYRHTKRPTCLHANIPTYLHTYVPTYLHVYIPTCLHVYMSTYYIIPTEMFAVAMCLRPFLTACSKELYASLPLVARKSPKLDFLLQLTDPYRLESTTLSSRLASSRNYKHSCTYTTT